ncbi:MAG: ATP-binding protein [Myxococcota bacterium]
MVTQESVLQKRFSLSELVDTESFKEVFQSFAELYRVGVKVFDGQGTKLVDVRVGNADFCGYLFQFGPTQQRCTALVQQLKSKDWWSEQEGPEMPCTVNCFSGLRYVVLPLVHEGEFMGRVIFGPFVPQANPEPSPLLRQLEPKLEAARLEQLMAPVRKAPDDVIQKVVEQMRKVVDVILFTSYRAMMVSQMHIESVTTAYQDLVEKNRRVEEANERLKEMDKLKSSFLATVSHELRTPLTSVIGYSEMLLEGMAGEMTSEQKEYVTTIMEKGESLLKLITSILDLSRIESGNLKLNLVDVDLYEVIKAAHTSVVPQAQKKKLTLKLDLDPGLPRIVGDGDKIRQILINLLGNSVKFTPEGGTITLRVKNFFGRRKSPLKTQDATGGAELFAIAEESFVRVEVEDTGIGIPADKLTKVFESFYQVDSSSTREHGGTGLGLSIVKSFVDAHKGDVWVESTLGKGATFVVLLPVERP